MRRLTAGFAASLLLLAFGCSSEGAEEDNYACHGLDADGTADQCWEATKATRSACEDQGRTFAIGDCSDYGYNSLCAGSTMSFCR